MIANFQMIFSIFCEVYPERSNWKYISIGSGNGSAPNMRQDIAWTNDGHTHWPIHVPYAVFIGRHARISDNTLDV